MGYDFWLCTANSSSVDLGNGDKELLTGSKLLAVWPSARDAHNLSTTDRPEVPPLALPQTSSTFLWIQLHWDSRSSENMAAKFMKRDTFIQKVIFEQIFHFWIFLQNFNCHTSQTSIPNFCIGFWNDIGNKNLRKTIFDFYQFPVKIILVGLCLKA